MSVQVLDRKRPFSIVYGSSTVRFEQDGKQFSAQGLPVEAAVLSPAAAQQETADKEIPTDQLESAKAFLRTVLTRGPVSKSQIYKTVELNNQSWDWVKKAADSLNLVKFQYQKMETWKLPQED